MALCGIQHPTQQQHLCTSARHPSPSTHTSKPTRASTLYCFAMRLFVLSASTLLKPAPILLEMLTAWLRN